MAPWHPFYFIARRWRCARSLKTVVAGRLDARMRVSRRGRERGYALILPVQPHSGILACPVHPIERSALSGRPIDSQKIGVPLRIEEFTESVRVVFAVDIAVTINAAAGSQIEKRSGRIRDLSPQSVCRPDRVIWPMRNRSLFAGEAGGELELPATRQFRRQSNHGGSEGYSSSQTNGKQQWLQDGFPEWKRMQTRGRWGRRVPAAITGLL